jgi:ABC-2 type transport system permease protein
MLDLLYNIGSISRYPQEMYRHLVQYAFIFLLPMLLIINTPAKALLGKVTVFEEFQLLGICLIFFYLSRKFWQFALRSYASGGN